MGHASRLGQLPIMFEVRRRTRVQALGNQQMQLLPMTKKPAPVRWYQRLSHLGYDWPTALNFNYLPYRLHTLDICPRYPRYDPMPPGS